MTSSPIRIVMVEGYRPKGESTSDNAPPPPIAKIAIQTTNKESVE